MSPNKCFAKYSEGNGQHALSLCDKEIAGCNTQSSVDSLFPALSKESKIKALENKLSVDKEVKSTQVDHQNTPALTMSSFSPDLIIEEIFEDDLESKFLTTKDFHILFFSVMFVMLCVCSCP